MNRLYLPARKFFRDDSGVTSIEYALIAALIALVIVVSVSTAGENLAALYTKIEEAVDSAINGG